MRSRVELNACLVETAVVQALSDAEREHLDLASRLPRRLVEARVRERAVALARSPLAQDQLLSLALEHCFWPGLAKRRLLQIDYRPEERVAIANRVSVLRPPGSPEVEAVVREILRRCQRPMRRRMADWLHEEALLQNAFWNHPDITAADAVRRVMLHSIPALQSRAEALASGGAWRSAVAPRFAWLSGWPRGRATSVTPRGTARSLIGGGCHAARS